jgi:hypothetical protein
MRLHYFICAEQQLISQTTQGLTFIFLYFFSLPTFVPYLFSFLDGSKNPFAVDLLDEEALLRERSLKITQFLVIISFIELILLKIRVRNVKFQIYEWQRATDSGAFTACFLIFTKRVTASGAFTSYIYKMCKWDGGAARGLDETRHSQWRAAICIFEILRLSLLFLIILI